VSENRARYPIAVMCRVLDVSASGYYAWVKRPPSMRAVTDAALTAKIHAAHVASNGTYGAPRLQIDLAEAGLVGRAALHDHRGAIPAPRDAEPGERFAQNGLLQRRRRPALAAVRRYLDLADAAVPGKRDTGHLVEPRPLHVQPGRGMRDEGFDLLREIKLPGFPVRPQDRVLLGFVDGHHR